MKAFTTIAMHGAPMENSQPRLSYSLCRIAVATLAMVFLIGCTGTRTYKFRIHDAQSDQPVVGVAVSRAGFKRNLFTHYSKARDHAELGQSDSGGRLVAEDVDDQEWGQTFTFSKTGFRDASIATNYQHDGISWWYSSPPSLLERTRTVPDKDGWFDVPLKRAPTSQPATAPASTD